MFVYLLYAREAMFGDSHFALGISVFISNRHLYLSLLLRIFLTEVIFYFAMLRLV